MAVRTTQRPRRSSTPSGNRGTVENAAKVAANLTALPSLSHAELKSQWVDAFGTAAPQGLSRRLMVHALAYDLQPLRGGRLKPSVRKELRQIAAPETSRSADRITNLTPGARLMREWRGTVHVVDVTEDGLVWNGRVYSSLSAIARTITGTRWSGNRFFGLRKRSDAVKSRTHSTENVVRGGLEDATPHSGETGCSNNGSASPQPADTAAYGNPSSPIDNTDLVAELEAAIPNTGETDLEPLPAVEPKPAS